jgi:hypothetical protein
MFLCQVGRYGPFQGHYVLRGEKMGLWKRQPKDFSPMQKVCCDYINMNEGISLNCLLFGGGGGLGIFMFVFLLV